MRRGADRLDRRTFLRRSAATGVGGVLLGLAPERAPGGRAGAAEGRRWSDPETWGGRIPGVTDVAVVSFRVILDVSAKVAGVVVEPGGALVYHPRRSITLESTGNVEVRGLLEMWPESPEHAHDLVFVGVDESKFVGSGEDVQSSDVGLWVMGDGVLSIEGARKIAWTRAAGAIQTGETEIELSRWPRGWRVGDELVVTPTASPAIEGHHTQYDTVRIAAIRGRVVSLDDAVRFDHPLVAVGRGIELAPEVLNLTRNVVIRGTSQGRAHVKITSGRPQVVHYASLRHLGPRRRDGDTTAKVLGRYGLHFHHSHGSRGSSIKGVVARELGSHAFVTHLSDGVTYRRCISHDTFEDAYWWDRGSPTHDVLYKRCVASLVKAAPRAQGEVTLTGFTLGAGTGNAAVECVAVGVKGGKNASGFKWPSGIGGVWDFHDCVAHNNAHQGIWVWQNTEEVHPIVRFVGYHNGDAGISHGAYRNPYVYEDCICYRNRGAGLELHAQSKERNRLQFENLLLDGGDLSDYAVEVTNHAQPPAQALLFTGCTFAGYKAAAIGWTHEPTAQAAHPELVDIVGCSYESNEFWLSTNVHPDTYIRVQDEQHGAIALLRADQPEGEYRREWNAKFRRIQPFA